MNVTTTGVTKAANLSLFMVNVAYCLRADGHSHDLDYSRLNLKAHCRGSKYVEETIKLLPEKPEPILLAKILKRVASLGRIHVSPHSFSFSEFAKVWVFRTDKIPHAYLRHVVVVLHSRSCSPPQNRQATVAKIT